MFFPHSMRVACTCRNVFEDIFYSCKMWYSHKCDNSWLGYESAILQPKFMIVMKNIFDRRPNSWLYFASCFASNFIYNCWFSWAWLICKPCVILICYWTLAILFPNLTFLVKVHSAKEYFMGSVNPKFLLDEIRNSNHVILFDIW